MMESMEQYYIATEDGRTEGPYLFESLETFYTDGKMTEDTLVCIVGSQEWVGILDNFRARTEERSPPL